MNKVLTYRYENGSSVLLSIENDVLAVEWLSGPFKGKGFTRQAFNYRDLGENRCLINWHEHEGPSFVTLLIDEGVGKVHGTALIAYNQDEPIELFEEATIIETSQVK